MFSRFSSAARRVLRAAEQQCRNHNHYYVGVEHVLLALLEQHDPTIEARLTADGVDPRELHALLRRALGTGDDRSWEGILVTPRVRAVVRRAEARLRASDAAIDPIDLFDAIRHEDGGLAADVLAAAARSIAATVASTAPGEAEHG